MGIDRVFSRLLSGLSRFRKTVRFVSGFTMMSLPRNRWDEGMAFRNANWLFCTCMAMMKHEEGVW